jgi:hypothetical protein
MAAKTKKIKYEPTTATFEYEIRNQKLVKVNGKDETVKIFDDLAPIITMKANDEIVLPAEQVDQFVKQGKVRSKAQMKERALLLKRKISPSRMNPVERDLVINDKPFEA